jgi:hypothetical protein
VPLCPAGRGSPGLEPCVRTVHASEMKEKLRQTEREREKERERDRPTDRWMALTPKMRICARDGEGRGATDYGFGAGKS